MNAIVPPPTDPITQWARIRLESIQFDVAAFGDAIHDRITPASRQYHADRMGELASLLRLHASLIEQHAAKFREYADA